jgi:hypothetical protein
MDARVLRRESEASVYLLKDKVQGLGQGLGPGGTSPPIWACTLNVWHLRTIRNYR